MNTKTPEIALVKFDLKTQKERKHFIQFLREYKSPISLIVAKS